MEHNEFINKVRALRESSNQKETTFDYLKPYHGEDLFADNIPNISPTMFDSTKVVKIADLYPNQSDLNIDAVNMKRKGKSLTTPYVIKYKNKLILIDGHHTVIAKKLNGIQKVRALYFDLDEKLKTVNNI